LRALDPAAANALDADASGTDGAARLDLQGLQVWPKSSPADPRYLPTDAAQVLGLATASILIPQDRLLAANFALHTHCRHSARRNFGNFSIPALRDLTSQGKGWFGEPEKFGEIA
jgi:hypothetical protein